MAKNITLAVDDEVLEAVRVIAAERKTTVNALVREFMSGLANESDRRKAAVRGLLELADGSTGRIGADHRWSREELYDDRLLPRHQRPDLRGGRED